VNRRRLFRFDGDRMRRLAGFKLELSVLMDLAELAAIYKEGVDSDATAYPRAGREFKLQARRTLVEMVWETVWDAHRPRSRRKRDQSRWLEREERRRREAKRRRKHDNLRWRRFRPFIDDTTNKRVIQLVRELFIAVGETPPSTATLRHDLLVITTGRERSH
jgi:hypothetical protein